MVTSRFHWLAICLFLTVPAIPGPAQNTGHSPHLTIYVTNERSGDLTELDASTFPVTATVPLGKRQHGNHLCDRHPHCRSDQDFQGRSTPALGGVYARWLACLRQRRK